MLNAENWWLYLAGGLLVNSIFPCFVVGLVGVMKEEMTDGKTNIWICNQWLNY